MEWILLISVLGFMLVIWMFYNAFRNQPHSRLGTEKILGDYPNVIEVQPRGMSFRRLYMDLTRSYRVDYSKQPDLLVKLLDTKDWVGQQVYICAYDPTLLYVPTKNNQLQVVPISSLGEYRINPEFDPQEYIFYVDVAHFDPQPKVRMPLVQQTF